MTRAETSRFVASFIRPHGVSVPATPIFADAVTRLSNQPVPHPARAPLWRHVLRPVVVLAVLPALLVEQLRDPDTVARWRKRLGSLSRRGRKRISRLSARWKRYFGEAW
jgi:hypothetical protein